MEEDAAADEGVPVLRRGRLRGEQDVGALVREGPGPERLVAPLADHVGTVGLPLPRWRPRRARRRGSRGATGDRESSTAGRSSRAGRRSGRARAPPARRRTRARAASARHPRSGRAGRRPARRRPSPSSAPTRPPARTASPRRAGSPAPAPSGPPCRWAESECWLVDEVEERDLAGERHPGQDRVVAEGQARLGVDVGEQGAARSPSRARRSRGRTSPPARPPAGAGPDRPPRPRRNWRAPWIPAQRRCPAPSGRRSGGRAWPGRAGRTPWCRRASRRRGCGPGRGARRGRPGGRG